MRDPDSALVDALQTLRHAETALRTVRQVPDALGALFQVPIAFANVGQIPAAIDTVRAKSLAELPRALDALQQLPASVRALQRVPHAVAVLHRVPAAHHVLSGVPAALAVVHRQTLEDPNGLARVPAALRSVVVRIETLNGTPDAIQALDAIPRAMDKIRAILVAPERHTIKDNLRAIAGALATLHRAPSTLGDVRDLLRAESLPDEEARFDAALSAIEELDLDPDNMRLPAALEQITQAVDDLKHIVVGRPADAHSIPDTVRAVCALLESLPPADHSPRTTLLQRIVPRLQIPVVHDHPWCPDALAAGVRDLGTLHWIAHVPYLVAAPATLAAGLVARVLSESRRASVIDLCSAARPTLCVMRALACEHRVHISATVTSPHPERTHASFRSASRLSLRQISTVTVPIVPTRVPSSLTGVRTMFGSFQSHDDDHIEAILKDAVAKGEPFVACDISERSVVSVVLAVWAALCVAYLVAPFHPEFNCKRAFFTFCLPLIPALLVLESVSQCMRTRSEAETARLVECADPGGWFEWEMGTLDGPIPGSRMPYLLGWPCGSGPKR